MSDTPSGNWGKIALLNAAVAGWLIYQIALTAEAPSPTVKIMQYVFLAGCLIGLAGSLYKLMAKP